MKQLKDNLSKWLLVLIGILLIGTWWFFAMMGPTTKTSWQEEAGRPGSKAAIQLPDPKTLGVVLPAQPTIPPKTKRASSPGVKRTPFDLKEDATKSHRTSKDPLIPPPEAVKKLKADKAVAY